MGDERWYYMNMRSYSCCKASSTSSINIAAFVPLLKLIAEPNRLRILCILAQNSHCVCELMEHTDLSQSLISHHLRDLKTAGLVVDTKKGLRVYYTLTSSGRKLMQSLLPIQIHYSSYGYSSLGERMSHLQKAV